MTQPFNSQSSLTSSRLLAGNTVWNLFGQLLPTVVGVVAVPPLVRGLGVERFGILSLAWVVIGYFSFLDLGTGRALTKLVADKLGARQEESIPPLVWTSLLFMAGLGLFGTAVALLISPWMVHRALRIPGALQSEALKGLYLLAISMPLVTLTSGLRGILEAQQRFRILTLIRIPISILSFAGPLIMLPFSHSMVAIIGVLVAVRIAGCIAHFLACFHTMPALRWNFSLQRDVIAPMVRFGGWMTVTNVIGPVMTYLDRFFVGGLLSVSAISFYTIPFDAVIRLTIIPNGITGVLFPAFAVSLVQDRDRTSLLITRGIKSIFLAVFPVVLIISVLAPEGLQLWLGPSFSQTGAPVLRWLAAGVLVNAIAYVPFVLIQSAGRPDIIAKVEAIQVPLYLIALWFLTKRFGIEGTAITWTARIILDAIFLFFFSERLFPHKPGFLLKLGSTTAGALGLLGLATVHGSLTMKGSFLAVSLLGFGVTAWLWALAPSERIFLMRARRQSPIQSASQ
ncbi:MAG TPA: flippase [Candidatus Angelobacter sp.]|nr:flippase [Candidatus Angelobacter sp.]